MGLRGMFPGMQAFAAATARAAPQRDPRQQNAVLLAQALGPIVGLYKQQQGMQAAQKAAQQEQAFKAEQAQLDRDAQLDAAHASRDRVKVPVMRQESVDEWRTRVDAKQDPKLESIKAAIPAAGMLGGVPGFGGAAAFASKYGANEALREEVPIQQVPTGKYEYAPAPQAPGKQDAGPHVGKTLNDYWNDSAREHNPKYLDSKEYWAVIGPKITKAAGGDVDAARARHIAQEKARAELATIKDFARRIEIAVKTGQISEQEAQMALSTRAQQATEIRSRWGAGIDAEPEIPNTTTEVPLDQRGAPPAGEGEAFDLGDEEAEDAAIEQAAKELGIPVVGVPPMLARPEEPPSPLAPPAAAAPAAAAPPAAPAAPPGLGAPREVADPTAALRRAAFPMDRAADPSAVLGWALQRREPRVDPEAAALVAQQQAQQQAQQTQDTQQRQDAQRLPVPEGIASEPVGADGIPEFLRRPEEGQTPLANADVRSLPQVKSPRIDVGPGMQASFVPGEGEDAALARLIANLQATGAFEDDGSDLPQPVTGEQSTPKPAKIIRGMGPSEWNRTFASPLTPEGPFDGQTMDPALAPPPEPRPDQTDAPPPIPMDNRMSMPQVTSREVEQSIAPPRPEDLESVGNVVLAPHAAESFRRVLSALPPDQQEAFLANRKISSTRGLTPEDHAAIRAAHPGMPGKMDQKTLYDGYMQGKKGFNQAVDPELGPMNHTAGIALDVPTELRTPEMKRMLEQEGWVRTVKKEPWHFEYLVR
jgi:hypothetical protein